MGIVKGIYLASRNARHNNYNLDYNDIEEIYNCNLTCDMLEIDLNNYDYIIATPPCNYYSRGNWRRDSSPYSLNTKHLLPTILKKLVKLNKPFIVENVRNKPMFTKLGLYDLNCYIYHIGRHTYWTNVELNEEIINELQSKQVKENIQFMAYGKREGGNNVFTVLDKWLEVIHKL